MTKLKFLPVFIFIALTTTLFSQKEANIWYFGHNAGLDFNSGEPIALTDGIMNTDEGCASIADSNGALLFYTDGTFIWNKNHVQMPNGYGLLGHKSSTQSGVIVPKPGSPNIYYVFTVDFTANPGGVAYSEVDMNLDGGLGDVNAIKNIQLLTPACEKITAVLHENNQDIWVIGHAWKSSSYMAWLVTDTGVNSNPVISTIGSYIGPFGSSYFNSIGYLKASAEGDRIAAAHWYNLNQVEIFDFNNSTGQLTNPITLDGYTGSGCYGVEFAPSAPILYVSERSYQGYIYQYDLSSNNQSTINNSRVPLFQLDSASSARWGGIQLGPNGRMYVSKRNSAYLGVINKPDVLGQECEYVDEGVYLNGKLSWIGLPSFIQSYFIKANFSFEGFCPANPTYFTLEVTDSGLDSIKWDFGDPSSGVNNFSTENNPEHIFTDTGTFEITLIVFGNGLSDTSTQEITLTIPYLNLGLDLSTCPDIVNVLDATTIDATYLWSDGSTNPTMNTIFPGAYSVTIEVDGCPADDTISVFHLPLPDIDLGNDPSICENEIFTFDATTPNVNTYQWQNNSTDPTLIATGEGNYSVTVTGTNGCISFDSAYLTINPLPVFSLGADTEVCKNENYLLDAGIGITSTYLWQNGSTNSILNVSQGGTYTVAITNLGCTSTDEVEIFYTDIPVVDLGNDILICPDDELILDAYFDDLTTYTWQNNSNLPTFTVTEPGIYSVILENICGTVMDEILIGENLPPVPLFIGNDTVICIGDSYLIDGTNTNTTHYLWHTGSDEPKITVQEPGVYSLTWANECGFVTESMEVKNRICECPVVFPNAFSPDGNGWNERFNTVSLCAFSKFNVKIFSRWGELLFETNDPSIDSGWDGTFNGKDVQEGVYVYICEFEHEFDKGRISGDITILR
ncbi:gliding motility-associated C-terminal domain-containing protein [Saprospiraceae bacterium]|nr:gliding motility-associated C-terminal domain-containing protein [Saprospiraceae bacterium]MDC3219480.1 gliding motility-associated C-terminal domain-containing protein [Saprospiraceae bacterium]